MGDNADLRNARTREDESNVRPALAELIALAAAVRPDWDATALRDALVACHTAGWAWTRTLRETVRLLCDPESEPRDLTMAARNPLQRKPPAPDTYERGSAMARELLGLPSRGEAS